MITRLLEPRIGHDVGIDRTSEPSCEKHRGCGLVVIAFAQSFHAKIIEHILSHCLLCRKTLIEGEITNRLDGMLLSETPYGAHQGTHGGINRGFWLDAEVMRLWLYRRLPELV
jgi:hypothetical protein